MTTEQAQKLDNKRIEVLCLTYGEPAKNNWRPQFDYSLSILRRLTLRVANIPRPILPLIAARRGWIRRNMFRKAGYSSPLEKITDAQVQQLQKMLEEQLPNAQINVEVIYEFRDPFLIDHLKKLEQNPPDKLLLVPMYIAVSDFTTGVSRTDLGDFHIATKGNHQLPQPQIISGFGEDKDLAELTANFILEHCKEAGWSEADCKESKLLMAAHGTLVTPPAGIVSGLEETQALADNVGERLKDKFADTGLGWLNHTMGGKWTEPELSTLAEETFAKGIKRVVYYPVGFLADNAETQQEGVDQVSGITWERMLQLPCLNADVSFIKWLSGRIMETLENPAEDWNTFMQENLEKKQVPQAPPAIEGKKGLLNFRAPILAGLATLFWLLIGTKLIWRGVVHMESIDSTQTIIIGLIGALFLAYFKGYHLFGSMARKNLLRIRCLPQPSPLYKLFPLKTYMFILMGGLFGMGIGMGLKSAAIKGPIVLGVGLALFTGGMVYIMNFRNCFPGPSAVANEQSAENIQGHQT